MIKVTHVEFSIAVGVSRPAVSDLVKRGIVDLTKGMDQAIIDYCSHLREKAADRRGGGEYGLTEERARLAHHQANIAALDEKVKEKNLIPSDIVATRWQNIVANVRAKFLSIPIQLAATCAESPRQLVEKRATQVVKTALDELSMTSSSSHK